MFSALPLTADIAVRRRAVGAIGINAVAAQRRSIEPPRRAPRAPSLRALVKLALKCDSAEQMGKQLKRRFDQSLRRRGIDPGRDRRAEAEAQLDRLLQD